MFRLVVRSQLRVIPILVALAELEVVSQRDIKEFIYATGEVAFSSQFKGYWVRKVIAEGVIFIEHTQ